MGLSDICKAFESYESDRRAERGKPLLARLDGRAFHTFTRDLEKPFDTAFSRCMQETATYLVEQFHAVVGYTQSDEISLAWFFPEDSVTTEYPFSGRFQKLCSVLSGMASAKFIMALVQHLPRKVDRVPHFDCRVWQTPTLHDAAMTFVWREDDAIKNSISAAAQAHFSPKALHGKHSQDKLTMLRDRGISWEELPDVFKRGAFFRRRPQTIILSEEERAKIAEPFRPAPDSLVVRYAAQQIDIPPLRNIGNLIEVLFEGAEATAR